MARSRLVTELNARKNLVSDTLDGVAETVRRAGEPLRGQSAALSGYADQAAGRLADLASGLRERDVAELAEDVEAFARRHPGAFAAGGFAAGILAARFLRSRAPETGEHQRPAAGTTYPARRPSEKKGAPSSAEGERHG